MRNALRVANHARQNSNKRSSTDVPHISQLPTNRTHPTSTCSPRLRCLTPPVPHAPSAPTHAHTFLPDTASATVTICNLVHRASFSATRLGFPILLLLLLTLSQTVVNFVISPACPSSPFISASWSSSSSSYSPPASFSHRHRPQDI